MQRVISYSRNTARFLEDYTHQVKSAPRWMIALGSLDAGLLWVDENPLLAPACAEVSGEVHFCDLMFEKA